jgi:hypothetical protein
LLVYAVKVSGGWRFSGHCKLTSESVILAPELKFVRTVNSKWKFQRRESSHSSEEICPPGRRQLCIYKYGKARLTPVGYACQKKKHKIVLRCGGLKAERTRSTARRNARRDSRRGKRLNLFRHRSKRLPVKILLLAHGLNPRPARVLAEDSVRER